MYHVKKVGVLSLAKISGALYFCMGLMILPMAVVFILLPMLSGGNAEQKAAFGGMGVIFLFAPVFYGVMGFVMGAIAALIYNLIASRFGGIEIELEAKPQLQPFVTSTSQFTS
jgi:hypothetical protein